MIKFGTGGWRAVIADGFTKANVQRLVAGLCDMMKAEGVAGQGLLIGYDRRFLSREAAEWAAEVAAGAGVPAAILPREAPTPLVMFGVREYGFPYGMMVTASHNPAIYNGVKVFVSGGRDASQAVTDKLEGYIVNLHGDIPCMPFAEAAGKGLCREMDPFNDYIDSILALVDTEAIRKARLKVVLDPMYGVSQTSLRTILMTARCDVTVIHERHDTLFGGRLPAPNVDTLGSLAAAVQEQKADIGLATDGDADRIGVIDDNGRFVRPNKLLVILYYYLLCYRGWRGPAVRNTSTTHLLDRVAMGFGQACHEVPVGFKHISAKMEETNALIGGESSGGLTVRGHIGGKDGIYAAALLCEMTAVTGKPISALYQEITARFGEVYAADADIGMTEEKKAELQALLLPEKALPEFTEQVARISYQDGCKAYFKNGGWVICRFSGTEPLLRICAEGPSPEKAGEYVETWRAFLVGR